jgi:hypothetical protein
MRRWADTRADADATVPWELDGPLTSNLTGITRSPSGVTVGAATATTVHVWQVYARDGPAGRSGATTI